MTDQERLEAIEANLSLLLRLVTRLETRLCKLIVHLGAEHLIETR
jgi:hypothetical protein